MDLDGPALAPPKGIKPNFDNPPNQNGMAQAILAVCAAVATVCLFLRAYARVYLLRKVQVEEILAICAFGCFWGAIWATFAMVKTPGYFVHQWNIRLRDTDDVNYYVLVFGVCYSIVLPTLKIAILVEWCRMFAPRGRQSEGYFWWGCAIVIFVQITSGIAIVIALNTQCIPHKAIYNLAIQGKCFDLYKLEVSSATIQLASDIAIMLLPQRVIWTLKMTWRKRMGVSVIFGLGLLACVSAAFRLAVTIQHSEALDSIYHLAPLVFWATAEMSCGFFIVCLPCIPKILKETGVSRNIKRAFGMKTSGTNSKGIEHYGVSGRSTDHAKGASVSNTYHKIDEDGVPLGALKGSESTEHLNAGITRTTRITVTQDPRTVSDDGSRGILYP
ncbi:uncharacterized protein LDX57_001371 [Aspergillus melleus]|uniref:uncharacterized protein n=1 Tax=Aspergillus melleus TaxID=138277 RepID=UPI001E8CAB4B|nr:uncharacterized protein LDX57_001371 [Aspergillus melleus]KAH8423611.1 hypothetical protein LDX57_001371 [Aspergillus melleus]